MLASASNGDVLVAVFSALTAIVTVGVPTFIRARKADKEAREAAARAAVEAVAAAAKAQAAAEKAADNVHKINTTLGEKNGNGDAMTMLAKSLGNQLEMMKIQENVVAQVQDLIQKSDSASTQMLAHIAEDQAFQKRVLPLLEQTPSMEV